jgi:hypothetical protein
MCEEDLVPRRTGNGASSVLPEGDELALHGIVGDIVAEDEKRE